MAGKVITSRQYERGLDSLNELRSLTLSDKISNNLMLPIGERNPSGSFPPSRGSLVGCDNQGGLLVKSPFNGYDISGPYSFEVWYIGSQKTYVLPSRFDCFTIYWIENYGEMELLMTTSNWVQVEILPAQHHLVFNYPVQTLYFKLLGSGQRSAQVTVYGFTRK